MVDIESIPTEELTSDLVDGEADVQRCELALAAGTTRYSGGSVTDRLATNLRINERIRAELKRRGAALAKADPRPA